MDIKTLRAIAKKLNAHHMKTCAGFYGSIVGGRFFQARIRQGRLEVYDWTRWHKLDDEQIKFHDHNGRPIPLPTERSAA